MGAGIDVQVCSFLVALRVERKTIISHSQLK